jgi:hypothetical protein
VSPTPSTFTGSTAHPATAAVECSYGDFVAAVECSYGDFVAAVECSYGDFVVALDNCHGCHVVMHVSYYVQPPVRRAERVVPFAYNEITLPDSPSNRRACLGTVTGSKVPNRSRGIWTSTGPTSVVTVFG